MNLRRYLNVMLFTTLLLTVSASCTPARSKSIPLTSFSENYVDVSVSLERNAAGDAVLSATFTPPNGHHLYSKDIPIHGLAGLGRPTLLELTADSQMVALGELTESTQAEEPDFDPKELLVYPAGPVTLSLPVRLPPGNGWVQDEVKITYMACSAYQCKPPVEGKIVQVRIPGVEAFGKQ